MSVCRKLLVCFQSDPIVLGTAGVKNTCTPRAHECSQNRFAPWQVYVSEKPSTAGVRLRSTQNVRAPGFYWETRGYISQSSYPVALACPAVAKIYNQPFAINCAIPHPSAPAISLSLFLCVCALDAASKRAVPCVCFCVEQ